MQRRLSLLLTLLAALPGTAGALSLDLSADYRLRGLSYGNLLLDPSNKETQTFFSEKAGIAFRVKKIPLETRGGVETTLEVGLVLQALGVAGSTSPVTAPLDRIAGRYPATGLNPWVQNAYLKVNNALALPFDLTVGRQPVKVGGGLVLSDDNLGFTGISGRTNGPGWRWNGFYYQPRSLSPRSTDKTQVAGASAEIPLAGTLEAFFITENDLASPSDNGVPLDSAARHFPGVRYLLKTDEFAFEGEAALQRGSANLAGAGGKSTYKGHAGMITAIWKQDLGKVGSGQARVSAGEASGDKAGTKANEAFFPSFGHRYDGLERDGWGDFFGASLYDAIGPSSSTYNGLPPGLSGMRIARVGLTPPKIMGMTFDVDYFLFQASRALPGTSRAIGNELDLRITHRIQERLFLRFSTAFFQADHGIRPLGTSKTSGNRFLIEISGSF